MQIRIFTIRAWEADSGSVEDLNSFLRSHRIATVERQFVADGANSFWSICVTFVTGASTAPDSSTRADAAKKRIDYREVLNEQDFALFAKLRTLRKVLADQEGVPAYALFTNDQLAEIVRRKVASKKSLGEINGVGEARIAKYADKFLAVIHEAETAVAISGGGDAKTQSSQP